MEEEEEEVEEPREEPTEEKDKEGESEASSPNRPLSNQEHELGWTITFTDTNISSLFKRVIYESILKTLISLETSFSLCRTRF